MFDCQRKTYSDAFADNHDNVLLARWILAVLGEEVAEEEQPQRHTHQHRGHAEGERVTIGPIEAFDLLAEDGRHEGGDETARVDGHVEERKELLQLAFLPGQKLITAEGGHARLDAAGAQRDQTEADEG